MHIPNRSSDTMRQTIPSSSLVLCSHGLSVGFLNQCYKGFFFSFLFVFITGFDENLDVQGELILQDSFQVWDPKSLIRKGRERHLFLFEISLVFSKEIKDSTGHTKYVYKNKLLVRLEGSLWASEPLLYWEWKINQIICLILHVILYIDSFYCTLLK